MLAKTPMAEAWNLIAAMTAAEDSVNARVSASDSLNYEFGTEDAVADWFLVHTYPGQDVNAFRWLARRGFGVFQPMMQRVQRATQTVVQGREPMFPGWLFVYCRDIGKHASRLRVCPGVAGILSDPATNRPIPIDQPEMTRDGKACTYPRIGFVEKLQIWSEEYNPNAPRAHNGQTHYEARSARNIKRSSRRLAPRERRDLARMTDEAKRRDIWNEEQWVQVMHLDPGARIGMLMAVLKSGSDVGASASAEA